MASTTFEKPMGTEIENLKGQLSTLNSKIASLIKTQADENITSDENAIIVSTVNRNYAMVSYIFGNYLLIPFQSAMNPYWRFVVLDTDSTGVKLMKNITATLVTKYIEQ